MSLSFVICTNTTTSKVVLFEFSDISNIGKQLHSHARKYSIDPSQITGVLEYALTTRLSSKRTPGGMYRLLVEMSKTRKTMSVLEETELVFHDSESDDSEILGPEDVLGSFGEPSDSEDDEVTIESILGDRLGSDLEESDEELDYADTYYLPILFTFDKNQKERMWKIWVVDDTVHRLQGLVTGKKQTYERKYAGKNVGKKNETTPEEQAKQSAETMWTKQLDKGYLPKCKEGKAMFARVRKATSTTGGHNINAGAAIRGRKSKTVSKKNNCAAETVKTVIKPMKANVWELADKDDPKSVLPKVLKYFDFDEGVYMQWKLDGWRCAARLQRTPDGDVECVLTTNNGKQYPWFSHLRREIIKFVAGREDLVLDGLDGEIYAHRLVGKDGTGLDDEARFSTISSMCGVARSEPHELESQINLVVFDLIDLSGEYDQDARFERLKKLFRRKPAGTDHVQMCETKVANFLEEVYDYHNQVAQEGYEGVVLRSRDLTYTQKRTLKMRKYKHFIDREYPIIDVEKDDGVDDEYFVWVCHDPDIIDPDTDEPKRFKAKPMGCREDRAYWYENYLEYVGMPLTVKFQEYSEDGVPRFPIGVGIREDQ